MPLPKLKKQLVLEAREARRKRKSHEYLKRCVATMRLWLAGHELDEIAEALGCTRERARSAQEYGFRRVRELMYGSAKHFQRKRVKLDDPWLAFTRAIDLQLHLSEVMRDK